MVGFTDRAYTDEGTLVPRSESGAVLHDPDEVTARTVRMVTEGVTTWRNGVGLPIEADSIVLHGDGPAELERAARIRAEPDAAGVRFAGLPEVLAVKAGAPAAAGRAATTTAPGPVELGADPRVRSTACGTQPVRPTGRRAAALRHRRCLDGDVAFRAGKV